LVLVSGAKITRLTLGTFFRRYGQVRGVLIQPNSRQMEVVEAFLGIPYASPPTGSGRYRLPKAPVKWSGVRTAEKFGAVCPQRLPDLANETATLELMPPGRLNQVKRLAPLLLANQSEDCLNLNLYVPGSGKCNFDLIYLLLLPSLQYVQCTAVSCICGRKAGLPDLRQTCDAHGKSQTSQPITHFQRRDHFVFYNVIRQRLLYFMILVYFFYKTTEALEHI